MDESDRYSLDQARHYAGWLRYTAKALRHETNCFMRYAAEIKTQRDFLTEYEAALEEAEVEAKRTMEAIQEARFVYQALRESK